MSDFSNSTLGVTGAGGQLGRAVIGYLQARGATRVVAITRDPAKLVSLDGVDVRHGDFDTPSSLDAALSGIDRLLVVSTDKLGAPGARIVQHTAAIDAAERAGVSHLVYTGLTNPYPDAKAAIANDHFWTEARIARFAGDWTILRENLYMDLVLGDAERAVASGKLIHATGDGRRAYVTRDDVAATAAGALLTATGRSIHDVTGSEALSLEDVAATIARASGRPVEATGITGEALVAGMVAHGLPQPLAEALAAFDTDTARGLYALPTDTVRRLAGREPTTLAAFLSSSSLARAA